MITLDCYTHTDAKLVPSLVVEHNPPIEIPSWADILEAVDGRVSPY